MTRAGGRPAFRATVCRLPRGGSIRLFEAGERDALRVATLKDTFLRETDLLLQSAEDYAEERAEEPYVLRRYRQSPNSIYLVAEDGDRLVAALSLLGGGYRRNQHVCLLGMAVLRSHWGRGVGAAILDAALGWAADNPIVQAVTLHVYDDNVRAITLYESRGFVEEGRLRGEVRRDDGRYTDLVAMRCAVPSRPAGRSPGRQ